MCLFKGPGWAGPEKRVWWVKLVFLLPVFTQTLRTRRSCPSSPDRLSCFAEAAVPCERASQQQR